MADAIWDFFLWASQFSWLSSWSLELVVGLFVSSVLLATVLTRRALHQRTGNNPRRRSRRRGFLRKVLRREGRWAH